MNLTTLDTSLSDLKGLSIIDQKCYGQNDYVSLVSIRFTEDIYKFTGSIIITNLTNVIVK